MIAPTPEGDDEHDEPPGDDQSHRLPVERAGREPEEKMSYHDAISHRLRRVYLPLLLGLLAIWLFRLVAYSGNDSWIEEAAIQTVPGTAVLGAVSLLYVGLIAIALWPSSEKSKEEDASAVDHGDLARSG